MMDQEQGSGHVPSTIIDCLLFLGQNGGKHLIRSQNRFRVSIMQKIINISYLMNYHYIKKLQVIKNKQNHLYKNIIGL